MLQNGDIILVRTHSLLAWLIRFFIKSDYNHAGIVCDGLVYESDKPGIVVRSVADALAEYYNYKVVRCKVDGYASAACAFVRMLPLRKGYDYTNLLLWQPIYRLTGWWFGQQSVLKMTCTEMVARAYEEFFDNPETVSVKEILENNHFVTV